MTSPLSVLDHAKGDWRAELRRRRLALSPRYRRLAAARLPILAHRWLKPGYTVACYMATGSELDTAPLMAAALARGCRVLLPRVPRTGRTLRFTALSPQATWRLNRFGILECRGAPVPLTRAQRVFVPLVGFDRAGRRLGQGGGFYDATLARFAQRKARPALVGVAFSVQRVDALPAAPWDVPMDALLTERGILRPASPLPLPCPSKETPHD